jgi:hypothetical protein
MTAEMVGDKLNCRCHSMLVQLTRDKKIARQKVGRTHLYLAADSSTADLQRQGMPVVQEPPLPAEIVVLALVEFIRTPTATSEQLASAIKRGRGVVIKAAQIEKIFLDHGLKKTLKTAEPPP